MGRKIDTKGVVQLEFKYDTENYSRFEGINDHGRKVIAYLPHGIRRFGNYINTIIEIEALNERPLRECSNFSEQSRRAEVLQESVSRQKENNFLFKRQIELLTSINIKLGQIIEKSTKPKRKSRARSINK